MTDVFEHVPLDRIKVGKHVPRMSDMDLGIEVLAESIRANGLLQPVPAYYDAAKSVYLILAGQRRLHAYHYLDENYPSMGYDKIPCRIVPEPETLEKKRALSLADNITQLPMAEPDLARAVTTLYEACGNHDLMREKFGITARMVDRYVRFARLPPELQHAIERGEIHPDFKRAEGASLRAVDALRYTGRGSIPVETVIELARDLAGFGVSPRDVAG